MRGHRLVVVLFLIGAVACSPDDGPEDRRDGEEFDVVDDREEPGSGDADFVEDADVDEVEDADVEDVEMDGEDEDIEEDTEDEEVLFDFLVTTEANDGEGSLRAALDEAFRGARIGFADHIRQIIVEEQLLVERDMVIQGLGVERLHISGGRFGRIFKIVEDAHLVLSGVRLIDGHHGEEGAAITNTGVLELSDCLISGHVALKDGGAIYNDGELYLRNCSLVENRAGGRGGALFNSGLAVVESTNFALNQAPEGGGIYNQGEVRLQEVVLTEGRSSIAGAGLNNAGEAEVLGSLFTFNTVTDGLVPRFDSLEGAARGAALYNQGELWMTNTTIFRNYGQFGGGVFNDGRARLAQSTILGTLGVHGGGLVHNEGAETSLRGMLIDLSDADVTRDRDILVQGDGKGFESLGYNVVGVVDENPGFDEERGDAFGSRSQPLYTGVQRLGAYGGPLESVRLNPEGRAFAHVRAEQCRDARGELLERDLRGSQRPVVKSCDAGAFQTDFMQETFDKVPALGDDPIKGRFLGRGFIVWSFEEALTEVGKRESEQVFVLAGKGSRVFSETIPGGVERLAIEMRKSSPAGVERQVEVRINGELVGTSKGFGAEFGIDDRSYGFLVEDLEFEGDVVIEVRNISEAPIVIENLRWSGRQP